MNPGMNLETPSILMESADVEATYQAFVTNSIKANPVMDLGFMKVFNFCDEEENYFAVREVIKEGDYHGKSTRNLYRHQRQWKRSG